MFCSVRNICNICTRSADGRAACIRHAATTHPSAEGGTHALKAHL